MRNIKYLIPLFSVVVLSIGGSCNKQENANKKTVSEIPEIKLPDGFNISYFAKDVDNARSLARGDKGTIFVGNRNGNKVYALVDEDNDGKADKQYTIASGLEMPNGVAFRNGALFVAEVSKVWRFDNIEDNLSNPPTPVLVNDEFPTDRSHGWKYIAFGPDGKLYVPVGAPCNICDAHKQNPKYNTIMRMNADGSNLEMYATGIRNTVGFTWHPTTKELWFTDNGRDMMGDDIPADELNHAPQQGMDFGYPYCHAGDVKDPVYGNEHPCSDFVAPVQKLGPHVAALGLKFYTGNMFPPEYKNQVFIAEHGSWNRSVPIGYRVTLVKLDASGKALSYEVFADGWHDGDDSWGRPVDVLELPDGSLLVSDDKNDAVYRITYQK
jgi:glucose/arabinose dehydrogenase